MFLHAGVAGPQRCSVAVINGKMSALLHATHTHTMHIHDSSPTHNWPTAFRLPTHTHPFNGPLSGTTQVSRYQKGKTNLDFTEARDSQWQWHQLDNMQVCTSLQTDNHARTPPLSFLRAGCPSCRPTNSVKALKGHPSTYCSIYICSIYSKQF